MSMVLGLSESRDKTRRISCHRRNDEGSGELDVFDAEGYFSAINETTLFHELGMSIRDDCHGASNSGRQGWREGRVSLDIPAMRYTGNHYHHHHHHHHHYHRQHSVSQPKGTLFDNTVKPAGAKEKKHRQPSSPGGKLASFFASLISQTVSKKKKSSNLSTQIPAKDSVVDEVQSPSHGWRRRRSSNTNTLFSSSTTSTTASTRSRTAAATTTTTTSTDVDHITKQVHSLSGLSGIRTSPLPRAINTPTKSYKDFRCKNSTTKGSSAKSTAASNLDWLDEKFKCIGELSDKQSNKGFDRQSQGSSEKERVSWVGRNSTSEESSGFKRFMEDDGGETDSSSDLFELQLNYECSSGLPVYESTCMDTIKRSSATPAITNT